MVTKELTKQTDSLGTLLKSESIQKRFNSMLKDKAPGFMSSILSIANSSTNLKTCNPSSIIAAAFIAASLDLPINQNLGFAYIIPYKGVAQFQMGWKGFIQLSQRTGQYKTINVSCVYEGELESVNRFTGEMTFNIDGRYNDTVVGYVAYFKMLNGFEKYSYMTKEEIEKHGKKYSKSYSSSSGQWQLNFDAMAMKTVIKLLLSKYGMMTTEIQTAVKSDQAEILESGEYNYIDNSKGNTRKPETETPQSKPIKKTTPKTQKKATSSSDKNESILPGEESNIKKMLAKLGMTEDSYFQDKKIKDLVRGEASAALKDLASQLNEKLGNK